MKTMKSTPKMYQAPLVLIIPIDSSSAPLCNSSETGGQTEDFEIFDITID
ncbi:MAG: hypothetical protein J6T35_03325 [Bacteroidales bacterium]|nr:hypothetical protein [Bacteroidales bacterium]